MMGNLRKSVFWWVPIALLGLQTAKAADQTRPNIILVMCDDLGWGDVGFNGNQQIKTPHLDQWAGDSLVFRRFYAQAPVCSPTRGSCLTGRHPYRYGIVTANAGHMREQELTLAELLREHGYRTGHFGKWHIGTLTKTVKDSNRGGPKNVAHYAPPQDNGFEVCFSTEAKVPTYDPMWRPESNFKTAWDSLNDLEEAVEYGTRYWNQDGEVVRDGLRGDDSRVIMDRAVPFIEGCASDNQPFFAVVWFHTPHLPVVAGPEHRALYPDVQDVHARNYFGCISAMDEQMGRLRSTLAKLGIEKNTLVTFCSDNGPEGNQKAPGSAGVFRGRKRSLYEGGIRVPAWISWPAEIDAGMTDYPAVTSDYLPTVVGIVGATSLDQRPIDGHSLLPVWRAQAAKRPRPIGFQSKGQFAWTDNRFKLIRGAKNASWELYDLLADKSESNDLASDHPEVVASMAEQAMAWSAACERSSAGADYGGNQVDAVGRKDQ